MTTDDPVIRCDLAESNILEVGLLIKNINDLHRNREPLEHHHLDGIKLKLFELFKFNDADIVEMTATVNDVIVEPFRNGSTQISMIPHFIGPADPRFLPTTGLKAADAMVMPLAQLTQYFCLPVDIFKEFRNNNGAVKSHLMQIECALLYHRKSSH